MPQLSRNGHRERLRKSFLSGDFDNVPDHVLLELYLTFILPRCDVKQLSYDLINTFGSLENVFCASPTEIMKVKGAGEAIAVAISLVKKINDRIIVNRNQNIKKIISLEDAQEYCKNELSTETVEKLIQVTAKNNGAIINKYLISSGSVNGTNVDARVILKNALDDNAAYTVIAHNHPNGDPSPSARDIDFTFRLYNSLREVKVELIDHIIVADNECGLIIHDKLFEKYFKEHNND